MYVTPFDVSRKKDIVTSFYASSALYSTVYLAYEYVATESNYISLGATASTQQKAGYIQ